MICTKRNKPVVTEAEKSGHKHKPCEMCGKNVKVGTAAVHYTPEQLQFIENRLPHPIFK